MDTTELAARTLQARARAEAAKLEMVAVQTDCGRFVLVDLKTRQIIASELTPGDVLRICGETKT